MSQAGSWLKLLPGMSGVELARRPREGHAKLRVVLTSRYIHILAEKGTHGFELLLKPYPVEALGRVLRTMSGGQARMSSRT